jgi:hypothetical protein
LDIGSLNPSTEAAVSTSGHSIILKHAINNNISRLLFKEIPFTYKLLVGLKRKMIYMETHLHSWSRVNVRQCKVKYELVPQSNVNSVSTVTYTSTFMFVNESSLIEIPWSFNACIICRK